MREEFTKYEVDMLTSCYDEPERYSININPESQDVAIIDQMNISSPWKLGKANKLVVKLLKYCELNPTTLIL